MSKSVSIIPTTLISQSLPCVTRNPTTPVGAAWLPGMRRDRKAVPALICAARRSSDPYLVDAAVEALRKIRSIVTCRTQQVLTNAEARPHFQQLL